MLVVAKYLTQTAIMHNSNLLNLHCIAITFNGITSALLLGGSTLHNVFKLPVLILANSVANSTSNSNYERYVNSSSLMNIEVFMCLLPGP